MATELRYGKSLPDQVDKIASLYDVQLEMLADVRDTYRERATLEREYATKLQVLAKKAADKKSRKIAALIVGNEPTKPLQDTVIRDSTLEKAYSQLVTAIGDFAADHSNLADSLTTQVIEGLRVTEKRHEDAKKRQMQHFQKMLSDRDKTYAERLKAKQKYDDECAEVDAYRQKQEKSSDDRHAERAARQYEQQQVDMLNSKNVYLISTAIANRAKDKFYGEDLPTLEDQFQTLQTQLLSKFTQIILQAQSIENFHLDSLRSHVSQTEAAFKVLDPAKEQEIFIDHNVSQFSPPGDWSFEPCATHYDTAEMSVDPAPKVYLQNRLSKCRQKLQEVESIIATKGQDVAQLSKLVEAYTKNGSLGNVDEVTDNYLEAQHQLASYATSQRILVAEIETITAALAGDEGAQNPHTFKSSSFSIPTTCAYCKSSIWGLSKQGKTCKGCGISVHAKCELKVPADCTASGGSGRGHTSTRSISSTLSRSDSRASSVSTLPLETPTPSSFAQPERISISEETYPSAKVIFDFTPTSPFELAVTEGSVVQVIEEDDGSGWVKVMTRTGSKGLVPASYLEPVEDSGIEPPAVSTPRPSGAGQQGSGKYVRGIYEYQPQGPDELAVKEGGLIQLTSGPSGGENYADGWWEGLDAMGKKGIFPSNYVEIVP